MGSFRELMDKIAALDAELDGEQEGWRTEILPQYSGRKGNEATLVSILPKARATVSIGDSSIPGSVDDYVVRIDFLKESSGWKLVGKEKWAPKPSWMGLGLFELSQQRTVFRLPTGWTASYSDSTKEFEGSYDDLKEIAFSNDRRFLYIRTSFVRAPASVVPNLLIYFNTDQNESTGSTTRDNLGPKISGWERRLELRPSVRSVSGKNRSQAQWAYEVVAGELGVPRSAVYFEQNNGWIRAKGFHLFFQVPLELLGLEPRAAFQFIIVDSWRESLDTVTRGEHTLTADVKSGE